MCNIYYINIFCIIAIDLPMGVGLKTKSGSYPIWMNKRAIKRAKIVEKRKTRQKNKAKRVGSRPWRK